MNNVKYVNPETGKTAVIRVSQTLSAANNYGKTLARSNRAMKRGGFVRAGTRCSTKTSRGEA